MITLSDKTVLVVGLGVSGIAASAWSRRCGARVLAVDQADTEALRRNTAPLRAQGVEVRLGVELAPCRHYDLAVVSPGVPWTASLLQDLTRRRVPMISELELGYQHARCLSVAISGTNGKTTTTELVERMLAHNQMKTVAAGNIGRPLCAVIEQSRDFDFLVLEVSSFQLEAIQYFRPAVAVLMNITPDHLDRYPAMADYVKAKGRLFMNQQPFDWAVIQSQALAQLRAQGITVPSRIITFSVQAPDADLYLDRGLIHSRLDHWSGPLLDMRQGQLRGPHNAENLMAALAVGRVLRLPLARMVTALQSYAPAPHRCELVAEIDGVQYINDSKATNVDAVRQALLCLPLPDGQPRVWLIAGGKDKGFGFHELGTVLAQRVKGAFLIGETREKIRAAWGLFTPCALADSLLEAVHKAARNAVAGDVVLLSPACSSFDQFQNYRQRGEVFRQAVLNLKPAVSGETAARQSALDQRLSAP